MKAFLSIIILFTLNYSSIKANEKYCIGYCKNSNPVAFAPCMVSCMAKWNCFSKETSILVQKNKSITETNIANIKKGDIVLTIEKGKKIDESTIKKEFLEAFEGMNDDFIYIEPKLIPIIPGDDPAVINKVSEFSEDNF